MKKTILLILCCIICSILFSSELKIESVHYSGFEAEQQTFLTVKILITGFESQTNCKLWIDTNDASYWQSGYYDSGLDNYSQFTVDQSDNGSVITKYLILTPNTTATQTIQELKVITTTEFNPFPSGDEKYELKVVIDTPFNVSNFDELAQLALAEKFLPIIRLDDGSQIEQDYPSTNVGAEVFIPQEIDLMLVGSIIKNNEAIINEQVSIANKLFMTVNCEKNNYIEFHEDDSSSGSINDLLIWYEQNKNNFNNQLYTSFFKQGNKIILSYWFFYLYNNNNGWGALGGLTNHHIGEWEGMNIVFNTSDIENDYNTAIPIGASTSSHTESSMGKRRIWQNIEKIITHPVVYVCNGSHATYFHRGKSDNQADSERDYHYGDGSWIIPQGITITEVDDFCSIYGYSYNNILRYGYSGNIPTGIQVELLPRLNIRQNTPDYWHSFGGKWGQSWGVIRVESKSPSGPPFVESKNNGEETNGYKWFHPYLWYLHQQIDPNVSLIVDFTADQTSGNSPLLVSFTDQSSNIATTWFWDFGDGNNSTLQDPSHTFQSAGSYDVSLTISDGINSITKTIEEFVNVVSTISANFQATPTTGTVQLEVIFTDISTGNPTTWEWDFENDGTIDSYEQNPTWIYSEVGTYTVSLTISDGTNTDTENKMDYITARAPLDFGLIAYYPFNGNATDESGNGNDGSVNGASLTTDRFGNENSAYEFDGLGDWITHNTQMSTNFAIGGWIYAQESEYDENRAFLGNANGFNAQGYAYFLSPTGRIGFSFGDGVTWAFNNYSSALINNNEWYFVYVTRENHILKQYINGVLDNTVDIGTNNPMYNMPNYYIGSNNWGYYGLIDDIRIYNRALSAEEITALFNEVPPLLADFISPEIAYIGDQIQLLDTSTGTPTSWEWDFDNDGTIDSFEQNPIHTYSESGTYTVSLTVSDGIYTDTETKIDYISVRNYEILFEDDFNDNSIDYTKWSTEGVEVIEENGIMKLNCAQEDNGGQITSVPINFTDVDTLMIFRRTKLHYNNIHFRGRLWFKFSGLPVQLAVCYDNYSYGGTSEFGIRILSAGNVFQINAGIWDEWFDELIKYNPDTGEFKYYINNELQIIFNAGTITNPGNKILELEFYPYGWHTGHYGYMDDFVVSGNILLNANFTADETAIPLGQEIYCSDTSIGNPTNWEWDFENDGIIDSFEQNPDWTYSEIGTYTVSLSISDDTNTDTETKIDYIIVHEPLDLGLVAYYPFNGNANDESGNGNDGSVNGAILTADRFGNENSAFNFDGNDDYINLGNDELLNPQTSITVSAWIYPTENKNEIIVLNADGGWESNMSYSLRMNSSDIIFAVGNGTNNNLQTLYPIQPLYNWYHLVGQYDGNSIKLFVNSQLVSTNEIGYIQLKDTSTPIVIGYFPSYGQYFKGKIDNIRIYNRALSESEIQELFGALENPENISISVTGSTVNLTWDAVIGATSYNVYSSYNPYSGFTLEEEGITASNWSGTFSSEKKFYFVKAVN